MYIFLLLQAISITSSTYVHRYLQAYIPTYVGSDDMNFYNVCNNDYDVCTWYYFKVAMYT